MNLTLKVETFFQDDLSVVWFRVEYFKTRVDAKTNISADVTTKRGESRFQDSVTDTIMGKLLFCETAAFVFPRGNSSFRPGKGLQFHNEVFTT